MKRRPKRIFGLGVCETDCAVLLDRRERRRLQKRTRQAAARDIAAEFLAALESVEDGPTPAADAFVEEHYIPGMVTSDI